MNFEIILLFIALLVTATVVLVAKSKSGNGIKFVKAEFMSRNEVEFWHLLVETAAPLNVAPQVAMGALLKAQGGVDKSAQTTARNSFDRKRVDFVLFDDNGQVKLLVELDDTTHSAAKDAARDRMTNGAGYKTLRLRRRDAPSSQALAALIEARLSLASEDPPDKPKQPMTLVADTK